MRDEPSTSALEFASLLGPLRRAVLKSTRLSAHLPDLSEPQIEVLRLLVDHGPMAPGRIAATLQIAASTLSNVLRTMTDDGLVQRARQPDDQRRVQVAISQSAMHLLETYDATSLTAIENFLSRLPDRDRVAFETAVPVMRAMLDAFAAAPDGVYQAAAPGGASRGG